MKLVYAYLVIINAAAFLIMLIDKENAKSKLTRIPERALLGIAALGGSLGTLLAMYIGRHKTKKPNFTQGVPILLSVHILIAIIVFLIRQK